MNAPNPKVDFYFVKAQKWQAEFEKLRTIALDCPLVEELKWGNPCYTLDGKNIVLMHGFKEYCALLFFKGALMNDPNGILIRQTEEVQSGRQIRFTNLEEIVGLESVLKAYINEAIEVEKSGMKVDMTKRATLVYPDELLAKLEEHSEFKTAFEALTPGRQRAYILHFTAPKQSKTRDARIEKCSPAILEGKGLND